MTSVSMVTASPASIVVTLGVARVVHPEAADTWAVGATVVPTITPETANVATKKSRRTQARRPAVT